MYSTFSLYSLTVRRARSKNLGCQGSPSAPRRWLTACPVGARRRLAPTEHAVNQRRGGDGELWQPRFFDRALRTVKEYNEEVEYIHLNPVRAGLFRRPEDWSRPAGSSYNEYAGMSAGESASRRTV